MWTPSRTRGAVLLAASAFWSAPALAHHPMGGITPRNFTEGLLSGIGHPIIGPEHLAFIVAIGIAAALVAAGPGLIAAFVAASTAGVFVHLGGVGLPLGEVLVAGSVIAAGALVAIGRSAGSERWLVLALLAGVAHGYAFGEAIIGAEQGVLGAYLIGLALISSVIALACMGFTKALILPAAQGDRHLRQAGVVLACVGVVMLAGSLVMSPA